MDPALQEQLLPGLDPNEEIEALIRLKDEKVIPEKLRAVTRFGDIITCRIRRGDVQEVYHGGKIISFKASRLLTGDIVSVEELSNGETQPDTKQYNRSDFGVSGKGVVVGIIDYGADFAHVDFVHPDGTSRFIAIWDQTNDQNTRKPRPFNYGRVFYREEINAALASPTPYKTLGYHPGKSDPKGGSHGSHVMGIAVGNGRSGARGVAPEADIIFVHISSKDVSPTMNLGDSVRLLEAIDFIQQTAGEKPLAINISVGRHGGSHDGMSLVEMGMDNFLSGRANTCICQSAGNYYEAGAHTSGIVQPGRKTTLAFQIDQADVTPNEIEIWYPGKDAFRVQLKEESMGAVFSCPLSGMKEISINDIIIGRIYHRAIDPNNGKNHINIFIYNNAPKGKWTIELFGKKVVDGRYHAWIERDSACKPCQSQFEAAFTDKRFTTGTICNGFNTIVVGAIDSKTGTLASFSSSGPTVDGRQKPNILAPGVGIIAARSGSLADMAGGNRKIKMSGTSMATPHVTGTVALILEAAPYPLSSFDIRTILLRNTVKPTEFENPERVGNGILNIEKVLTSIIQTEKNISNMNTKNENLADPLDMEFVADIDYVYEDTREAQFRTATPHAYTPAANIPFNCRPPQTRASMVTQFPNIVSNPETVIEQAFSGRGISAADIRTFRNNGGFTPLLPVARHFGDAFSELIDQLNYSNDWIIHPRVTWGNRDTAASNAAPYLAPRLLLAIPGFFRTLARRTRNATEAYCLESLGWLVMYRLRDLIGQNTNNNWWLPPMPAFVQALPARSFTYISTDITDYAFHLNAFNVNITEQALNSKSREWLNSLAGQFWRAETGQIPGETPGLLFYPNMVGIPAAVNTQTQTQQIDQAWQVRLNDVDRAFPMPSAATPEQAVAVKQQRMQALTDRNQPNPGSISGLFGTSSFGNVRLAYEFPQLVNTRNPVGTIQRIRVLSVLVPVVESVFQTVEALGWNDLLFQTMGGQLFRGIATNREHNESPADYVNRAYPRSRRISEHSYGLALDLNVVENPQGRNAQAAMSPRLISLFEAFGFTWGYCFNPHDGHHFEYAGTPVAQSPPVQAPAFTPGISPEPSREEYEYSEEYANPEESSLMGSDPHGRKYQPVNTFAHRSNCACSDELEDHVMGQATDMFNQESGGGTGKKLKINQVKYLSFEGGGGKGLIYIGALKALEKLGILQYKQGRLNVSGPVKGLAGASAGSITAMMLSMGYSAAEIQEELSKINLNELFDLPTVPSKKTQLTAGCVREESTNILFLDFIEDLVKEVFKQMNLKIRAVSFLPDAVFEAITGITTKLIESIRAIIITFIKGIIKSSTGLKDKSFTEKLKSRLLPIYLNNLYQEMGFFSGCNARNLFAKLIEKKTKNANLTFDEHYDLFAIKLIIVGYNVEKDKVEYFSMDTTPNMCIADAVRISMSLPFIYQPVRISRAESLDITRGSMKGANSDLEGLWLDGGARNNSPIRVFENEPGANPKTLGIRLGHDAEASGKVDSLKDLIVRYSLIPSILGTGEVDISSTSGYREQTIELDAGAIQMWDFKPESSMLNTLIKNAELQVLKYFPAP